jgi:hypothetical protein
LILSQNHEGIAAWHLELNRWNAEHTLQKIWYFAKESITTEEIKK